MRKTLYHTETLNIRGSSIFEKFRELPISKISRELIFANRHFWGSKKEYIFATLAKIREIREIFFPQKFLPLRYTSLNYIILRI